MDEEILDCRGVPIEIGDTVVRAGGSRRLLEFVVKELRVKKDPHWAEVLLKSGGWTTPDRVAVVVKANKRNVVWVASTGYSYDGTDSTSIEVFSSLEAAKKSFPSDLNWQGNEYTGYFVCKDSVYYEIDPRKVDESVE